VVTYQEENMDSYNRIMVDAVAEKIWWNAFKKHHADELHLYDDRAMPQFSRMAKRRKEHYRKKAEEMLTLLYDVGFKVEAQ
jgi:hypothetical protein